MPNNTFKTKLAQQLCHAIKELAEKHNTDEYKDLQIPCREWTDRHFRLADMLTGISSTTLKRLYLPDNYPHESFNKRTREKFYTLLSYNSWESLVEDTENQIIKEKVEEVKNFS
jgi:hypothetical protein